MVGHIRRIKKNRTFQGNYLASNVCSEIWSYSKVMDRLLHKKICAFRSFHSQLSEVTFKKRCQYLFILFWICSHSRCTHIYQMHKCSDCNLNGIKMRLFGGEKRIFRFRFSVIECNEWITYYKKTVLIHSRNLSTNKLTELSHHKSKFTPHIF